MIKYDTTKHKSIIMQKNIRDWRELTMDISIIGVPIFYGADKSGTELAPNKLREKNIANILSKNNHSVYDFGNLHVPEVKEDEKFSFHSNMKYLKPIVEVNTNLAHLVYSSIKAGSFPLVVGGDHSVGIGSIAGASRAHKNFAVIWMDAHADINTHDTSESANVHGMPLAKAMGIGYEDLINIYFEGKKVPTENVYIIGARALDEGEVRLIKEKDLNVLSVENIRKKGIDKVTGEIIKELQEKNIDAIHLSFDLDVLDTKYVPGTGTPVDGGLDVEEAKLFIKSIMKTKLLKSMDFVELNVLLDKDDATADLSVDLLDFIFS